MRSSHEDVVRPRDGTKIVYQNFCGCPYNTDDIYVANADGTGATLITPWAGADNVPRWSPDGNRIVFVRNVEAGSEDSSLQEIFVMDADGSNAVRLTNNPYLDGAPAWSPDGTRIVFMSGRPGQGDLYLINPDGTGETRLTDTPDWTEAVPEWSPDGKEILFTRQSLDDQQAIISILKVSTGNMRFFSDVAGYNYYSRWSPDGDYIVFSRSHQEVEVMRANGTHVEVITSGRYPDWVPSTP